MARWEALAILLLLAFVTAQAQQAPTSEGLGALGR